MLKVDHNQVCRQINYHSAYPAVSVMSWSIRLGDDTFPDPTTSTKCYGSPPPAPCLVLRRRPKSVSGGGGSESRSATYTPPLPGLRIYIHYSVLVTI